MIGGVAGAAIAAGPLIGGWVTTELSWRYVFVGEVVIVVGILLVRRRMQRAPRPDASAAARLRSARPSPPPGSASSCSASCKSSSWGLIEPRGAPTINGHRDHAVRLLGRAVPDPRRLRPPRRVRASGRSGASGSGQDTLLDRALLRIEPLRAGLSTLMMQQLLLMGTFFVLPVYLQVVLGLDAFETGKRLFPMSVDDVHRRAARARGSPRASRPKRVVQPGSLALVVAASLLLGTIDVELNDAGFALALALFGIGAGLLLSQLGNVIMSSVDPSKTNEAGGLQGTAQNLGASLGTALIGAVLLIAC